MQPCPPSQAQRAHMFCGEPAGHAVPLCPIDKHPCFPAPELLEAPRAAARPHVLEMHGDSRTDPYYWLRDDDRKDADVIAHLKARRLGGPPLALLEPWSTLDIGRWPRLALEHSICPLLCALAPHSQLPIPSSPSSALSELPGLCWSCRPRRSTARRYWQIPRRCRYLGHSKGH